jgi:hypothetical protein
MKSQNGKQSGVKLELKANYINWVRLQGLVKIIGGATKNIKTSAEVMWRPHQQIDSPINSRRLMSPSFTQM